jgi:hypothetical protein
MNSLLNIGAIALMGKQNNTIKKTEHHMMLGFIV